MRIPHGPVRAEGKARRYATVCMTRYGEGNLTYTVPDAGHAEEVLERPDLHLEERAGQTTVQGSHGP